MYYIALKMLFGDRGKYIAMVFGISFSALIMTQQPSVFAGLMSRTYSFMEDISLPDVWVMDPGVQYSEEHKPIRDIEVNKIKGITGVAWAVPIFKNLMAVKLPDGFMRTIDLTGIDDSTFVGGPAWILQGDLEDLKRKDAIFVDYEAAHKNLRVTNPDGTRRPLAINDIVEINDHRAVVVGYIKAKRSFVLQPKVYTTYSRALSYQPPTRRQLTYVAVKAKEGQNLKQLCQRIKRQTGLKAYTTDDFKAQNLDYWMTNTGIPINFGTAILLGFIVGAAVVGQTFYNFVQENLKHYAALKAMGLRNHTLIRMVMLQACVVGATGYGIGVGLTTIFGLIFDDSVLAFRMMPSILAFSALGIFLIITLSAVASIRKVINVDPSVVFRG